MNELERYEFDRVGYLVIPGLLTSGEVATLAAGADDLEQHALSRLKLQESRTAAWGHTVRFDSERQYFAMGSNIPGESLVIEDFWNASDAFDLLIGHDPTMGYVSAVVQGRTTINNSELRIRYRGNATLSHMGGPVGPKFRYSYNRGDIDCMMVRMIYFLHDVAIENGPFAVVPATHKSNFKSPYCANPDKDPALVGLPVKAGDAILFTENLRHGGLTNLSATSRKTLHVGYGPHWLPSQNSATIDQASNVTQQTLARLSEVQRRLFMSSVAAEPQTGIL